MLDTGEVRTAVAMLTVERRGGERWREGQGGCLQGLADLQEPHWADTVDVRGTGQPVASGSPRVTLSSDLDGPLLSDKCC